MAFLLPCSCTISLMVTMGAGQRVRPRVTLSDLLVARDASLRVSGSRITAALVRARRLFAGRVGAAGRGLLTLIAFLAAQVHKHGLVLAGLTSFVLAAALYSAIAALCVAGVAFLFLELRRR